MEQEQITFLSYLSGGCLFAALTLVFIYLWRIKTIHPLMILAAATSTLWHLGIAANYGGYSLERPLLLFLETARYCAWVVAILASLHFNTGQRLPLFLRTLFNLIWIVALTTASLLAWTDASAAYETDLLIWSNLSLAIFSLVCVEQLYRNTNESRLVKLLSIAISAIFIYDIYLFSHSLIFEQIDQGLWQARGAVNGTVALIMALGALAISTQSQRTARLSISRPVVFYTTSLSAAGSFLALMAIGGFYVQSYGGQWGSILQVILLFLAMLSITAVFISRTIQSRLNVWINKNFFHHKYDYRVEWLKLINDLSQPTPDGDFNRRALDIVAAIFKSPHSGLWLNRQGVYSPETIIGLTLPETDLSVPMNSPFCQQLKDNEWVFSVESSANSDSSPHDVLPPWMLEIPQLWLVLPLLTENDLLGFIVLTKPKLDPSLTWEDLDLLKAVGRQVASYLEKHQAAELLVEAKQFDAFNKLTAFIMHDLKNLIAQQGLVVENAAKHKENPAFVEDAIRTIENSVGRMNTLLKKLQQNEPSEFRSLELHKVLMESVKKCQEQKPVPILRLDNDDIKVNADLDRLIMTFTHVIKNAQEATKSNGFVDVTLRREDNNAIITVEDNGSGMDEEFIKTRLFKPFVTTKSGKGMGIGVYQTKEFIASLGGDVTVNSTLGEGSTFTIRLPIISI